MNANFWLQKWQKNEIAFHKSEANPVLIKYFKELNLAKNSRIFLPLCGKTLDIAWLLANGYHVAGVELIEMAIDQLFAELGVEPSVSELGKVKQYSADNINIFVGDIFDISGEILSPVNAVYDRAALVALPKEIRNRYTAHLAEITNRAPQLLVTYEYDQNLMAGPPFSISHQEINQHYSNNYDLTLVSNTGVLGGLKGKYEAKESVWLLR
ncbi:MAG: thiopurine S-methyltransferase [Microcoleaceae cyanobacterium]